MDFELIASSLSKAASHKADALLVLLPEGATSQDWPAWLQDPVQQGDADSKAGSVLSAYRLPGAAPARVLLAGVGEARPKDVRAAVAAAMSACKGAGIKRLHVVCVAAPTAAALRALVLALFDATYSYGTTKPKATARQLAQVRVSVPESTDVRDLRAVLLRSVAIAQGVEEAKEWGNRPANHATPTMLGQEAKRLARSGAFTCQVLGPNEVAKLGMGALQAVAQGSAQPLRFIVLQYNGAAKTEAPVVLVGKGITFDSGGISLKPAAEMDEMKFDMCGAASVLGTFRALAELKPAVNVVGLIVSCENLPGPTAVKPGDVITTMAGQTVEILNTDAEGRLVLCDALCYAERFKPRAVIDIATLTGACVVALGAVRSGYFASDEALAQSLEAAAHEAQDLIWRLPLDDDYAEGLRTNFADVANVAGRAAGAVTAAKFLQRFAGQFAWAHLDIAGTAWKSGAAKGSTGRPVGLLVEYLLAQAASLQASAGDTGKAKAAGASKAKPAKSIKASTKTRKAQAELAKKTASPATQGEPGKLSKPAGKVARLALS
ncbi:leucyl aminopeptidase [Comamonas serinivorans]|uniref:Probable cytosol aminopeptidase n=1 Tax=Comamonas serinivorans TaxID=1082851 RepID=A0A1Y0EQ68_9BURK|nr:leucyl aminopeptidase [Comamonas serinivorans]ARU05449.1 leucyl aminopeptidase [Comamonas serinivorans]